MLVEYQNARQEAVPSRRRWFEDEGFDLVVWYGPQAQTEGFQIIYSVDDGERALTWREGRGFEHSDIDPGDASPLKNLTPILNPDGAVPWARIRNEFSRRSQGLEPGLRRWVERRLELGT